MMFAQALKKHLFFERLKPDANEKPSLIPKKELKHIILGFLDEDQDSSIIAPYSIQKIAKSAFEEFKHKPGEWYNPSNINFILEKLHNMQKIKGAENMEILISNDGMVFLDKMLEKIEMEKCECDWEKKLEKNLNGINKNKSKEEFCLIKDYFEDLKKSESEIIAKKNDDDSHSQSSNGKFFFFFVKVFFFRSY